MHQKCLISNKNEEKKSLKKSNWIENKLLVWLYTIEIKKIDLHKLFCWDKCARIIFLSLVSSLFFVQASLSFLAIAYWLHLCGCLRCFGRSCVIFFPLRTFCYSQFPLVYSIYLQMHAVHKKCSQYHWLCDADQRSVPIKYEKENMI